MENVPLKHFVAYLTKEEIRDNARMLGEKIPVSWNKERMSLALAAIYEREPGVFLPMLSETTINLVHLIFQKNLNARLTLSKEEMGDSYEVIVDGFDELMYLGLAVCELDRILIADIMKKTVAGYLDKQREQLKRWQQMEYCAFGILVAYGIVEMEEYARMFRGCYPEFSEEEALVFLRRRIGLRLHSSRLIVDEKEEWIYCDIMDEPEEWYELLREKQNISYRIYTNDEYISMFRDGYHNSPAKYMELVDLLMRNGLSEKSSRDSLLRSALEYRNQLQLDSEIPGIVEEINWQSDKDLKTFISLYFQFTNDISLWSNKGHSPNEMVARMGGKPKPAVAPQGKVLQFPGGGPRVGRNDLCPCGSGKKYKHCCGKLN